MGHWREKGQSKSKSRTAASQQAIICSKLSIKTLEQGVKYVQR